jgi:hypothetical protein
VALAAAGVAFLIAAVVLYFALSSARYLQRLAAVLADVNSRSAGLATTLRSGTEALRFPPPPPVDNYFQPAYANRPPELPPVSREAADLKAEMGQFAKSVKDCFTALRLPAPPDLRDLELLIPQVGRQAGVESARAQYKAVAKTLARFALSAAEDDWKQNRATNAAAETALRSLLDIAGLRLLVPLEYEPYSEIRHDLSNSTEPAEHRSRKRGSVARVERRGLLDLNNEVIQKAVVVLYD